MHETPDELTALDRLLTESLHRSTEHLRSIVTEGERTLDAAETCRCSTGMRTLSLATVTARGEPRISGVDGHFLHARWVFTTSGTSAKVRHLRSRPAVSVAHLVGDDLGVFCHGQVEELTEDHPETGSRSRRPRDYGRTRRAAGARRSTTPGCSRTGW